MGPGNARRVRAVRRATVESIRSESEGVAMSSPTSNQAKRNRWMDWHPKVRTKGDSAGSQPTKPSKPGSVGFEGATSAESSIIRAEPNLAEVASCGSPKCQGCYKVAPGVRLHPPKPSQDWLDRVKKWCARGEVAVTWKRECIVQPAGS